MKNLLVFASAMMVGAAAFADVGPRVYKYSASLKTTVAKTEKVTFKDAFDGTKTTVVNCYRKAGSLALKGVFFLDCDCYDFDQDGIYGQGDGRESTTFLLLNTSFNAKNAYFEVPYGDNGWSFYNGRRFGSSVSTKAKDAELGLALGFTDLITVAGDDSECGPRGYELLHAGFGKVTTYTCKECGPVVSSGDPQYDPQYDIASISGSVVGVADAPFCFTSSSTVGCGFCGTSTSTSGCGQAVAFWPCEYYFDATDEDYTDGAIGDYPTGTDDTDVVFGTWKLTLDTSLSKAVAKAGIGTGDVATLKVFLAAKVFGKNAVDITPVEE